jgi:hypothetical protein
MSRVQVFFRELGYGIGTGFIVVGLAKGCWYLGVHHIPFVQVKPDFGIYRNRKLVYETPVFPHISDEEGRKAFMEKVSNESTMRWWRHGIVLSGKEEQQWQQLSKDVKNELERLMALSASKDA